MAPRQAITGCEWLDARQLSTLSPQLTSHPLNPRDTPVDGKFRQDVSVESPPAHGPSSSSLSHPLSLSALPWEPSLSILGGFAGMQRKSGGRQLADATASMVFTRTALSLDPLIRDSHHVDFGTWPASKEQR